MSGPSRGPRALLVAVVVAAVPLIVGIPVKSAEEATESPIVILDPIPADVAVVEIDGIQFLPDTLRIRAGETVEWRNGSKLAHTVTADPEKAANPDHVRLPEGAEAFDSGNLAPGETWRRTFDVPGVYDYFCVPHEAAGMVGTMVVEPAK